MGATMKITKDQTKALERRNMENDQLVLHKLDNLTTLAERNDRALRGHNGDNTGLMADMAIVKPMVESMHLALEGNPDNRKDRGMLSEHLDVMDWMQEGKDGKKWLNRLVIGTLILNIIGFMWSLLA